jgi:alpha-L-fucosidase
VSIKSLSSTLTLIGKINEIQMLGSNEKIKFERTAEALNIQLPGTLPSNYALCFKMKLDETNVPTYEVKLKE